MSVATLERRLCGVSWRYRQLGTPLDAADRHISTVLAGIRRKHARPPVQKEAIFADELLAMLATLEMDLRGLRDRAILALGFAGGLRRSEIVGLDCGPDQTEDGTGWIEIFAGGTANDGGVCCRSPARPAGARSRSAAARAPKPAPSPLLETWMRLGRIAHGPLFRPIARKNGGVSAERLSDKHVARLVQKCALKAGVRGDLTEGERRRAFGGHSLRAGLASSAADRRGACAKAPRPRQRGNDPALPAKARPLPGQSHQSRRALGYCDAFGRVSVSLKLLSPFGNTGPRPSMDEMDSPEDKATLRGTLVEGAGDRLASLMARLDGAG